MEILKNFWFIQGIGAIALIFVILAWNAKTRRNMLLLQSTNLVFFIIHYSLLGALAGGAMCVVTLARNFVFVQNHKKWAAHWAWFYFFVLLSIGVLIVFWKGWITILPVTGVILGIYAVSQKNPADIRFYMFITCLIWMPYNIVVQSYSGLMSQIIGIIAILMGIYRHDRKPAVIE